MVDTGFAQTPSWFYISFNKEILDAIFLKASVGQWQKRFLYVNLFSYLAKNKLVSNFWSR